MMGVFERDFMRESIEGKLHEHNGDKLFVPYADVSIAFPSDDDVIWRPDVKLIDKEALFDWVLSLGWRVRVVNDMKADDGFLLVEFTRAASG